MPQTKERRKELYQENREDILARQRKYLQDHPDKARQYNQNSYWGNPESRRAKRKEYYQENKDAELLRNREYQEENKESIQKQRQGYYLENRETVLAAVKEHRESTLSSLPHVKQRMLARTKYRAKKYNIPFNLSLDDITIPDVCPVFKVPFDFNSVNGIPSLRAPSIDKIIPSLGYVKGNVQVISYRANQLKSNASLEELESLVEFLRKINNDPNLKSGDSATS